VPEANERDKGKKVLLNLASDRRHERAVDFIQILGRPSDPLSSPAAPEHNTPATLRLRVSTSMVARQAD
jgi:hypothetical protein